MAWLNMLRMWLKSGAKVKAKARRAAPRLRPGVELLETRTLMNSPPTLAAIPDQTFIARQGLVTVTLVGSDADNDPLTYSGRALLMGTAYQLDQQLGLSPMSAYYMNFQGHNEKWLQGNDAQYCVLPNGELRRWRDTAYTYGPAGLVATLDSTFWTDPSRLWDAKPAPTLTVQGNQLTIDPAANFVGSFQVEASVSDGQASASRVFTVIVTNSTPVLGAIADQSMPTTQDTLTLTLTGTDADSDPLTFSGRYADAAVPALAYQLDQQLGLSYMGSYYTDFQGNAEKWLQGAKGQYFILPNGELRLWWNQLYSYGAQGLVAKLNPNYYADPSLLWSARSVPAIGLPVKAYNLDQQLGLSYTGNYYTNFQGHNEKWLQGTGGQYLILPNGKR